MGGSDHVEDGSSRFSQVVNINEAKELAQQFHDIKRTVTKHDIINILIGNSLFAGNDLPESSTVPLRMVPRKVIKGGTRHAQTYAHFRVSVNVSQVDSGSARVQKFEHQVHLASQPYGRVYLRASSDVEECSKGFFPAGAAAEHVQLYNRAVVAGLARRVLVRAGHQSRSADPRLRDHELQHIPGPRLTPWTQDFMKQSLLEILTEIVQALFDELSHSSRVRCWDVAL